MIFNKSLNNRNFVLFILGKVEREEKMEFRNRPQKLSELRKWYIWYTKPRNEKKVRERLLSKGVEVYLPLRRELRQWSDRKKWVELPLFGGYIFTHIGLRDFDSIEFVPGILTYLRTEGRPATLRDKQIEEIRTLVEHPDRLEVLDHLKPGEPVEITYGPLKGLKGEIISVRGQKRIAIRVEQLGKSVLVRLPAGYVRKNG